MRSVTALLRVRFLIHHAPFYLGAYRLKKENILHLFFSQYGFEVKGLYDLDFRGGLGGFSPQRGL
jgi:hypothetical protein